MKKYKLYLQNKFILKMFLGTLLAFVLAQNTYAALQEQEELNKLKAFVESGIDYINKHGPKKAYEEFNNLHGKFKQGKLYMFVYDLNGVSLAYGSTANRVGKNFYTELDRYGTPVIRLLIELAKAGGGFFSYYWPDPDTEKVGIKTSYIAPVNKYNIAIGSGVYKAINVPQAQISIKLEEVKAFVRNGIDYFKKHEPLAAYKELSNPKGPFRRGNMYMFVYNYKGVLLASSGFPKDVGKNFYETRDEFGSPFVQLFIQIAQDGGGSVSCYWPEPNSGKVKLKVNYVMPLGKDTLIGSGFYGD
jgi:signal transduction histidine kinase